MRVQMTSLKNNEVLAEFEYGSRFKNVNDQYSDYDKCYIVRQPLVEALFNIADKQSKVYDEDRYYTAEKFIMNSSHGTSDSTLLLTAFMTQAKNTELAKAVFAPLYDPQVFAEFLANHYILLVRSSLGQYQKYLNDARKTLGSNRVSGKTLFNIEHQKRLVKKLLTPLNVANTKEALVKYLFDHEEYHYEHLHTDIGHDAQLQTWLKAGMKRKTNLIEIYNMYNEQSTQGQGVTVTDEVVLAKELLSHVYSQLKGALDIGVNELVLFETGQLNLEKDCPVTQQLRENYVRWLLKTATV